MRIGFIYLLRLYSTAQISATPFHMVSQFLPFFGSALPRPVGIIVSSGVLFVPICFSSTPSVMASYLLFATLELSASKFLVFPTSYWILPSFIYMSYVIGTGTTTVTSYCIIYNFPTAYSFVC